MEMEMEKIKSFYYTSPLADAWEKYLMHKWKIMPIAYIVYFFFNITIYEIGVYTHTLLICNT